MKSLGQYFTTNIKLQSKVFEFIKNEPSDILEPSVGRGDLVCFVKQKMPGVNFDMYEIDNTIIPLIPLEKMEIIYADFLQQKITKKYKTIIGNPPYVRTKKGNLYLDFIEKCFELLEENGELIFIVPSDFFKLTCAVKLNNKMTNNGTFTHIFCPNEENLFKDASIDVMVFRYCKDNAPSEIVCYNDEMVYLTNSMGLLTIDKEKEQKQNKFSDYFDIYVGIVSGKESVFKVPFGNIEVLNAQNKKEKYICLNNFPCEYEIINEHLEKNKEALMSRRIRSFNESNWWQWGALRNVEKIKNNKNKDCIYVSTMTRKKEVAFQDKVCYFGGSLIIMIPKEKIDLNFFENYLNSEKFKNKFTSSGRFKIGHRQLCNSYLPS